MYGPEAGFALQATQAGNYVTGGWTILRSDGTTRGGNLQGSISGSTLAFTLNIAPGSGCPQVLTGDAQVSGNSIEGTYSGTYCDGTTSNGRLTMLRP
jgi:hypothetical protein